MDRIKEAASKVKSVAEEKLELNDYSGAKEVALKAQILCPDLEGISQLLATIQVYISAQQRINGEVDYYGVLGVNPTDNEDLIKKQYKRLALILHPDKNRSVGAHRAFQIIQEAWDLLSDRDKRLGYDERRGGLGIQLNDLMKSSSPSSPTPAPPKEYEFYDFMGTSASANQEPNISATKPSPVPTASTSTSAPTSPQKPKATPAPVPPSAPAPTPAPAPKTAPASAPAPAPTPAPPPTSAPSPPPASAPAPATTPAPPPTSAPSPPPASAPAPAPTPTPAPSPAPAPDSVRVDAPTQSNDQGEDSFWTRCQQCNIFCEFARMYLDKCLLCPKCKRPFLAVKSDPPCHPKPVSSSPWSNKTRNVNADSPNPNSKASKSAQGSGASSSGPRVDVSENYKRDKLFQRGNVGSNSTSAQPSTAGQADPGTFLFGNWNKLFQGGNVGSNSTSAQPSTAGQADPGTFLFGNYINRSFPVGPTSLHTGVDPTFFMFRNYPQGPFPGTVNFGCTFDQMPSNFMFMNYQQVLYPGTTNIGGTSGQTSMAGQAEPEFFPFTNYRQDPFPFFGTSNIGGAFSQAPGVGQADQSFYSSGNYHQSSLFGKTNIGGMDPSILEKPANAAHDGHGQHKRAYAESSSSVGRKNSKKKVKRNDGTSHHGIDLNMPPVDEDSETARASVPQSKIRKLSAADARKLLMAKARNEILSKLKEMEVVKTQQSDIGLEADKAEDANAAQEAHSRHAEAVKDGDKQVIVYQRRNSK